MSRRLRIAGVLFLTACFFSMLTDASYAAVSAEELQKIESAVPTQVVAAPGVPRKMLVFNLCGPNGFRHSSIPYWDKALEIMGQKSGAFSVVVTSDMSVFEPEKLKQFDAVCFNNTTRLQFEEPLRKSLMEFIKGGKGIVGIHAATDNFYDWPEAAKMMGGQFSGHPWGGGGTWAIKIDEPDHPLMKSFEGKGFKIKDEIYRTKEPFYSRSQQLVLMSLDMADDTTRNVKGVTPDDMDTGISWVKTYGKGRLFYCSLGHDHAVTWNPAVLWHYLAGIQFALGDLEIDTKPKPMISSGKGSEMDELMGKVKSYDWGESREALTQVSDLIRKAHGSAAELGRIEASLIAVLDSDAKRAGKQFVCRQLSIIGTERCVPTLAKMLTNDETADMARYALERIPGPAVDEALRGALGKTGGKAKIGVINSLGQRRDEKAVAALSGLIGDGDKMIAEAAVAALGQIADDKAAEALAKVTDSTSGKLQMVVLDSYLKCADRLAADGKRAQAIAIYRQLQKKSYPKPIQTAALRGMLNATRR
jgi:type 1 glutamine amidotransferase